MGRPSFLKDPIMLTCRVERQDWEALVEVADARGKGVSEYFREVISRHLSRAR